MDLKHAFNVNRETWNHKTAVHFESDFYDKHAFAKAKNSLNHYEQQALGDVTGKSMLHLQCHFGQDSLSWANKGAVVTGIDISDVAIDTAKRLSAELNIPATFVCCNVLDVSQHVKEHFDLIFTSYGVIGWLPDLKPWARMIVERLKKGGVFYMVEFHPIAWMFDYTASKPVMKYNYSNTTMIYEEYEGTYADVKAPMTSKEYVWNHSLSEVIQSLIDAGLTIDLFAEHNQCPYNIFPDMVECDGMFQLKKPLYPILFELKASLES
jgi:2-polyprenyl-3-methyl-5-hydroxy-6-metoxy-1,4-benzoquinol methylase